jgi:hypothetical protein
LRIPLRAFGLVRASVARAGSWWNFDVYHALGTVAAEDANLRAHEAVQRILIDLKNLAGDDKYASCQKFLLGALSESVEAWFETFLVAARTVASEVCRPVLSEAGALWARCEADYRTGFKEHTRRHLKNILRKKPRVRCTRPLRKDFSAHGRRN